MAQRNANAATDSSGAGQERFALPWDLSEWASRENLRLWVGEEVGQLDWQRPELVRFMAANPAFRPRELLGILTYAYAVGLFESDEILLACSSDPGLRHLSKDYEPTKQALVRFRRENRGLLKWTLTHTLKRVVRAKLEWESPLLPPGLSRCLVQSAVERLDMARHLDRAAQGA